MDAQPQKSQTQDYSGYGIQEDEPQNEKPAQKVVCRQTDEAGQTKVHFWVFKICIFLSISSCSIQGSFQGLYSYQNKTKKIAPNLIQKPTSAICTLSGTAVPVIYSINGRQLKSCVEHTEKALVYIWRPKCSSETCISPSAIQDFCNENEIELYIIAEYYDYQTMSINYSTKKPILGVDCDYYGTNLTKKYMSHFLRDLTSQEVGLFENYYFLFQDGCLLSYSDKFEGVKFR